MKSNKLAYMIMLLIGLQSCLIPEGQNATLEKEPEEIIKELKALKDFENVILEPSTMSFETETFTQLVIQFYKGKNLSEDEIELEKLGKTAFRIVINSMENEADFDLFKAEFIKKITNKGLYEEIHKTTFEYSLDDLTKE